MVFQVQAELLAEAGLVSRRQDLFLAPYEQVDTPKLAVRLPVGRSGQLLVGSILVSETIWLGAFAWLAFRVLF
jgi:hypothetical protein